MLTNISLFHQSSRSNSRSQDKITHGNRRGLKSRIHTQNQDEKFGDFEEYDGNTTVSQAPGFQSQQHILTWLQSPAQHQPGRRLSQDPKATWSNDWYRAN